MIELDIAALDKKDSTTQLTAPPQAAILFPVSNKKQKM